MKREEFLAGIEFNYFQADPDGFEQFTSDLDELLKERSRDAFISGANAIGTGVDEIIERKADEYITNWYDTFIKES